MNTTATRRFSSRAALARYAPASVSSSGWATRRRRSAFSRSSGFCGLHVPGDCAELLEVNATRMRSVAAERRREVMAPSLSGGRAGGAQVHWENGHGDMGTWGHGDMGTTEDMAALCAESLCPYVPMSLCPCVPMSLEQESQTQLNIAPRVVLARHATERRA